MRINHPYLLIFFILLTSQSCGGERYKKISDSRYSMGTMLTITLFCDDANKAQALLEKCYAMAADLEKKLSNKVKDSVIYELNEKKTALIVDDVPYLMIKDALKYARMTGGAFDPALYNLVRAWGFDGEMTVKVPDKKEIDDALKKSGYKNIVMNEREVRLLNGVSLDFGGIAKGRIIGLISDLIKNNGIYNFIVNGGGDLVVKGKYNGERPWKIAIVDPYKKNDFIGYIELTDSCIVTSGDYERSFTSAEGITYHHIIDPITGHPADNGVHSVTVIADSPEDADALATALFVMGADKGLRFIKTVKGVEAIFISGDPLKPHISSTPNITVNSRNDGFYDFIYLREAN